MSGTKRISGALAAVAMTGLVLGACVSPGAGLGAPVRDENHLPAAVVPAGRDTDKLAGDAATRSTSSLVQGGGAEREAIKQAAEQAATTSQEAQANNRRAAADQAAARAAEQAAVSTEAWANAQRAAAESNTSSALPPFVTHTMRVR